MLHNEGKNFLIYSYQTQKIEDNSNLITRKNYLRGYTLIYKFSFRKDFEFEIDDCKHLRMFSLNNDELFIIKETLNTNELFTRIVNYGKTFTKVGIINDAWLKLELPLKNIVTSQSESKSKLEICDLTNKNQYLVLFMLSHLILVDIRNKNQIICDKSLIDQRQSMEFFLSPVYLNSNVFLTIKQIQKSDNMIALNSLNNIVLIKYDHKLEQITTFRSPSLFYFESFVIESNLLITLDKSSSSIMGYDLNDLSFSNESFNEFTFSIKVNNQFKIKHYGITPNCEYFYLIEKVKTLKLYRWSNEPQLIGKVILYCEVDAIISSNNYITMAMKDMRILSFLIGDPLNSEWREKVKKLESRSEF
jgi:hypothetical protein